MESYQSGIAIVILLDGPDLMIATPPEFETCLNEESRVGRSTVKFERVRRFKPGSSSLFHRGLLLGGVRYMGLQFIATGKVR